MSKNFTDRSYSPVESLPYKGERGKVCPHCGSEDWETASQGRGREFHSDWLTIHVECQNCGTTWNEDWEFQGINTIVVGNKGAS